MVNPDADPCGGTFKYFVDGAGGGQCTTGMTTVYTAGSPIDTPQALYPHDAYPCSLRDRTVQPTGPTTPDGRFNYYEAVPSDPAEWAAFTEEVVPVTNALAVTVWVGADGSRLPHGLRLLPSKTPCSEYPPSIEPRAPRSWCIPTVRARPGDGFPTDQCTGEHLAGACAPTDVIELSPTDQELDLFETGGLVSTIYFQNPNEGGKCMTFPPAWTSAPNTSVFYRTGSPLDYERYPTLAVSRQGTGRIQVQYLTSGGTNLFVQSYFDTKYEERCTPTELSSGGTWCVPTVRAFALGLPYNMYADSGCTQPVVFIDSSQPDPHRLGLVYPPGHTCTSWGPPTLYSVANYSGPIFESSGGLCRPSQTQVSPDTPMLGPTAPIEPSSVLAAMPE